MLVKTGKIVRIYNMFFEVLGITVCAIIGLALLSCIIGGLYHLLQKVLSEEKAFAGTMCIVLCCILFGGTYALKIEHEAGKLIQQETQECQEDVKTECCEK